MQLKGKLVAIVTGIVFLVVATTSWLYLSRSLRQYVDQSYASTDIVAHQVLFSMRQAVESGVRNGAIQPSANAATFRAQLVQSLANDSALNALLDSVISYSPTIFDITIVDSNNKALISTDPALQDKQLSPRPPLSALRYRSPVKILRIVFGKPQVYDVGLSLERPDGFAFATVHVGVRTTFLLNSFKPSLLEAFSYTFFALLTSLFVAVVVTTTALAPLEEISRRLDAFSAEVADTPETQADTMVRVSSKIERIGARMRNAEEVFSALKENLDQILSNLQDGMMLFTRDARAVLVSRSVERFLGASREGMLGADVVEVFPRSSKLGVLIRDAYEIGQSLPPTEVQTETGHRVEVTLDMIHDERENLGALLTFHDLESVRAIENELELSRRLSAIGRLTGGVGHEVKNPINAIVVHLELMRNKLSGPEAPALRHLNVIQSEIQRLDRVVQSLVDFSRPMELQLKPEDLRDLISKVLLLASVEMAEQDVRVASQIPPDRVIANVDADMLRQALLNIVLNGAQAMPGGGTLTVRLQEESHYAVITVSDTGEGIPQDVLPRIFDLYFTTKKDGSGIGLAMCYRIVQLHSGYIDVQSEPGHGTTFTLRFPLKLNAMRSETEAAGYESLQGQDKL